MASDLDRDQYSSEPDPTFVNSRREAIVIFCTWFVALIWAVTYCKINGYDIEDPANIPTTLGMPSWVVWGIAAPWLAADLFTTWFCFCFMKDDELGIAGDEEHLEHVVEADG